MLQETDSGHTDIEEMKIETDDHSPISKRPFRAPVNKQRTIDDAIDEMLEAGFIVQKTLVVLPHGHVTKQVVYRTLLYDIYNHFFTNVHILSLWT